METIRTANTNASEPNSPWENLQDTPESKFNEIIKDLDTAKVTVYERLNASNDKAAKAEFLENPSLVHPRNEYGNLDESEVRENFATLARVEQSLQDSGLSDKRQRLIRLVADDYKKKNEFLAANLAYNSATTDEEKSRAAEWHHQANEALYGKADEATFRTLMKEQISAINRDSLSEDDKKQYDWLISEVGNLDTKTECFKPRPETVARFSELTQSYFANFLKHIPDDRDTFTPTEMVNIINEIADTEFGGDDITYRAIIDPKAANASTNHEARVIKFPEDAEYTRKRLGALIVHEFGTHTMRAVPYLNQDIKAFASELPGNETIDEGIAKCVEQALGGKYEDSGIDHYLNIGLATFEGKNFREVYNIQKTLKHLTGKSDKTVLNAVQRCFRGTGELVNNKDLAYYNGANQVWQYIESHLDDPELFDNLFLTGKINFLDPAQESLSYEMRTSGL